MSGVIIGLTPFRVTRNLESQPCTWRPGGLIKSVISRVIIGLTPFRVITYNSTYNLFTKSPGHPSSFPGRAGGKKSCL